MMNFSQVLYQAFLEVPDQIAVYLLDSHKPTQKLSYRDLFHKSAFYAQSLSEENIQPGDVVVLILQHGEDLVTAFFGAILQGAIPAIMPFLTEKLLPEQYRASLAALFGITAPTAVITYPEFETEVRRAIIGTSVHSVLISSQVTVCHQPEPQQLSGFHRSPDDIVLLQHSSGTTGLQKGVALSHRSVFNQLESYSRALRLNQRDVIVSWLPLYHDMGLIAGFILPILMRVPLVLLSPFDWVRAPHRLLQAISQYQGTLCWLPNFAYNFCAQKIRPRYLEGVDLSSLRSVINCSEPMHWKSHAMFLESFQPHGLRPEALATCYAMAENVFAVTQGGIESPVYIDMINRQAFSEHNLAVPAQTDSDSPRSILKMLSAGKPIEGTRVRVIDSHGRNLPERHIGEIALQSNCMLSEYYHRPDLTTKAFLDGWYLTGDLGYLVGEELFVTGRKKDLIIVGGKNIYPQDLEHLAGDVEGVHPGRVVAFGVFNEEIGTEEVVIVAEVDKDGGAMGGEDIDWQRQQERIVQGIRRRVIQGSDVSPRKVVLVARNWLVKTSSGKIARQANKAKYLAEFQRL